MMHFRLLNSSTSSDHLRYGACETVMLWLAVLLPSTFRLGICLLRLTTDPRSDSIDPWINLLDGPRSQWGTVGFSHSLK
jgi:hypothetical protein